MQRSKCSVVACGHMHVAVTWQRQMEMEDGSGRGVRECEMRWELILGSSEQEQESRAEQHKRVSECDVQVDYPRAARQTNSLFSLFRARGVEGRGALHEVRSWSLYTYSWNQR